MNILVHCAILDYQNIHLLDKYFLKAHHDHCISSYNAPNYDFLNTNTLSLVSCQLIAIKPKSFYQLIYSWTFSRITKCIHHPNIYKNYFYFIFIIL